MHTEWVQISDDEKVLLLGLQETFSNEKFEKSKIKLEWVNVNFYPGYYLIRATIEPQLVRIRSSGDITLAETHQSYFLYNRDTHDLSLKIIPLEFNASWLRFVNKLISVRLSSTNIVSYLKYFGLVMDEKPFYFFDRLNEIPWSDSATDIDRERLYGALDSHSKISESGVFTINVCEDTNFLAGRVFKFTIPVIYEGSCYAASLRIASDGSVLMDQDYGLYEKSIGAVRPHLPYYKLEPTKFFPRDSPIVRGLKIAGIAFAGMALVLAGLGSLLVYLIGLSDLAFAVVAPAYSTWLNEIILSYDPIGGLLFWCVCLNLFVAVCVFALGYPIEYIAKQTPGVSYAIWEQAKTYFRQRLLGFRRRVINIVWQAFLSVAILSLAWGYVWFWLQNRYHTLLAAEVTTALHDSIVYAGGRMLRPLFLGNDVLSRFYDPSFLVGVSTLGVVLQVLMSVSFVLLVVHSGVRVWQLSRPA